MGLGERRAKTEEEEEEKRKEERRKEKRRSQVWNCEYLYEYMSWVIWNVSIVLYGTRRVWKSSIGLESLDTWFETLSLCMVWVWKLPNSFLVRVELRRVLRLLDMWFGKGLVVS